LGVGLSPTGNFKNAKQGNAEKATHALYEFLKLGRLYNLSIKCQLDFFDKPLIQCRQHTRYKTIVNIFLACLQVRLRLFLNHDLNYKSKKDSRS
jgi:hypothetical protein